MYECCTTCLTTKERRSFVGLTVLIIEGTLVASLLVVILAMSLSLPETCFNSKPGPVIGITIASAMAVILVATMFPAFLLYHGNHNALVVKLPIVVHQEYETVEDDVSDPLKQHSTLERVENVTTTQNKQVS